MYPFMLFFLSQLECLRRPVSFVRLIGLRLDFERALIGLRPNSLHWPDSSWRAVLVSSSLVHCPHAVQWIILTSVHI